jgi:2-amino-4-hydroxy-6-hydroxymethyldihydropteridine diphosphokinase
VGSNIRPEENIPALVRILLALPRVELSGISTFYRTPALSGPGEPPGSRSNDPDYLNGVLEIRTSLGPTEVETVLRGIEMALGRVRSKDKFAPRTMDVDVIWYLPGPGETGKTQDSGGAAPSKLLPSSEIFTRPFVAVPLAELAPDLILPPDHTPIRQVVLRLSESVGEEDSSLTSRLQALTPIR